MSEWISVKDKLPDHSNPVLLVDDCGCMLIGTCHEWGFNAYTSCLYAENYDGGACVAIRKGTIITHWMPLPEAPK